MDCIENNAFLRIKRCILVVASITVCIFLVGCSDQYDEGWILTFPPSALVVLPKIYVEGQIQSAENGPDPNLAPCESDPVNTIQDLAMRRDSLSKKVPAGLVIDNNALETKRAKKDHIVWMYSLPSDVPGQGERVLKISSIQPACRVQSTDGQWWLAIRNTGGDLTYVAESETEAVQ